MSKEWQVIEKPVDVHLVRVYIFIIPIRAPKPAGTPARVFRYLQHEKRGQIQNALPSTTRTDKTARGAHCCPPRRLGSLTRRKSPPCWASVRRRCARSALATRTSPSLSGLASAAASEWKICNSGLRVPRRPPTRTQPSSTHLKSALASTRGGRSATAGSRLSRFAERFSPRCCLQRSGSEGLFIQGCSPTTRPPASQPAASVGHLNGRYRNTHRVA